MRMIRDVGLLISAMWVAFVLFWVFEATQAKRRARGSALPNLVRLLALIAIALSLRLLFGTHVLRHAGGPIVTNPVAAVAGAIACAAGIGIAIWARIYLGRNWGMPMSLREGHELVTSGPYAYVRHPIYSGIFLALIGTSVVKERWWIAFLAIFFIYFLYAARVEERTMREQFPNEYPAYARRTKMLVPFVL